MTQAELAALIGVGRVAVNRWENGVQAPDFTAQKKLMELLGPEVLGRTA